MLGKSKSDGISRTSSKGSDIDPAFGVSHSYDSADIREHIFAKTEVDLQRLISNKASFSQVPMKFAGERADNGSVIIGELCKIFQGRVDMEDREIGYSIKVSRPNLYENEIRMSTSERALGYLKNYYLFLSREQAAFRRRMDEEVVHELDAVKAKRLAEVARHKESVEIISQEVHHLEESLRKAKTALAKCASDVERYQGKLKDANEAVVQALNMTDERRREKEKESKQLMGRFFSAFETTPEQDRDKCLKKLAKYEADMQAKRRDIVTKKKWLLDAIAKRDEIYAEALLAFEAAEKNRLHATEKALRKFCGLEREALEGRLRLLAFLEEDALQNLNSDADIELFTKRERNIEDTHKYAHAMHLLDWDHTRRNLQLQDEIMNKSPAKPSKNAAAKDPSSSTTLPLETGKEAGALDSNNTTSGNRPRLDTFESVTIEGAGDVSNAEAVSKQLLYDVVVSQEDRSDSPIDSENHSLPRRSPLLVGDSEREDEFNSSASYTHVMDLVDQHIFVGCGPAGGVRQNHADGEISADDMTAICEKAFADAVGMDIFLQILDDKRGRSAVLGDKSFDNMAIAMKVFLDQCYANRDVKSALRLANMSITFHKRMESPRPSLHDSNDTGESLFDHKCYIQHETVIHQHKLWHLDGFWEDALLEGVMAQLDLMDPVEWDELDPEQLKEKVIAMHNVVFGQLGTMAFTMHEMGLSRQEVENMIMSLSEGAQLGEDQQQDLLRSIGATFQNTLYPSRSNSSDSLDSTGVAHDVSADMRDQERPGYEHALSQTVIAGEPDAHVLGGSSISHIAEPQEGDDVTRRIVRRVMGPKSADDEVPMTSAVGVGARADTENLQDHL